VSLLLLFNPSVQGRAREIAREVAAQTDEDLERLREVFEDAAETRASPAELAERLNQHVPHASKLAPLLQQGSVPLATWLLVVLTIIMLVLQFRAEQRDNPVTPEQIQQIVDDAVHKVEHEAGDEPEPEPPPPAPRQQP